MRASRIASQTRASVAYDFEASPGGDRHERGAQPARLDAGREARGVERRDGLVRDDRGGAGAERRDPRAGAVEEPAADEDVVGAPAERHPDGRDAGLLRVGLEGAHRRCSASHASIACSASCTTFSCGISRESTVTSASA